MNYRFEKIRNICTFHPYQTQQTEVKSSNPKFDYPNQIDSPNRIRLKPYNRKRLN